MIFRILVEAISRSVATRARVMGFLAVAALGLLVAWATGRNFLMDRSEAAALFVDVFGLTLVIPVAAMVFGTAALGDSIEDGTYLYLWLRPIRRGTITLAAYLVTLVLVVTVAVVPTVAASALIDSDSTMVGAALAGGLLAAVAYSAVFVLMGHLTSRALAWGIGYLLIFEQFISRGGRGLGAVSVHSHAVSLMARLADVEIELDYFGVNGALLGAGILTVLPLVWSLRRQVTMDVA